MKLHPLLLQTTCLSLSLLAIYLGPTAANAQYGTNLIQNAGAEAGSGSSDGNTVEVVPDWNTHGTNFTVVQYGASGGFPDSSSPGPADEGANFFAGGPDNASSEAEQLIDVSAEGTGINAGTVTFTMSGWLGGYDGQDDNATLTADFLGAGNANLGDAQIGPVFSSDRNGVTGFLFESTNGAVPIGTQTVDLILNMTRESGAYNDGYADNLSLELFNNGANQQPPIGTPEPSGLTSFIIGAGMCLAMLGIRKYRRVL